MKNNEQQETTATLTIKQFCKLFNIGRTTVWAGIKSGRFPKPFSIGGRAVRFLKSEVLACLAKFAETRACSYFGKA